MTFDAAAYKATTKRQWDDAAEAWHRWGPTLEDWLGEATAAMLDAAGVGVGSHVLDVAGGAGGQAMAAARRTGPDGSVAVTDVSPAILAFAQRAADEDALRHVTTLEVDGEEIGSRWSEEFDAAISRLGLIYLPDRAKALHGIRSSLRDGARFADVEVETLAAPLLLPSAADCVRFERESFGALHQMLSGLDEDEREQVWDDIASTLQAYETEDGFVGPCELHVVSGSR